MPKFLTNIDMNKNEIQNVRLQSLASPPAGPVEGQVYYDTTLKVKRVYNGTKWTVPGEGNIKSVEATAPVQSTGGTDPVISIDVGTISGTVASGDDSRFPTTSEKAALAGTSGIPSSTNKYVTNTDSRLTNARTPASHSLTGDKHTASGLTAGHFLKATGASTFGFAAHGLTKADVGLGNADNKSSATIRGEITSSNVTTALGFTPEDASKKGKASGYAELDVNAKIPLAQLPDVAKSQTYVVANPTGRQALSGMLTGDRAYETETGDSYIWDGTQWLILADADWENVNLQWANIVDKPTSTIANIDDAVTKRHSHSNKTTLDSITSAGSGSIMTSAERTKLTEIEAGANKYTHPTDGGGSRTGLTGATVISGITVNTAGHVTATTTRELTPANIGATRKFSADVGGSTSQVITHNLGTRDVVVMVREAGAPYAQVYCDVEMTTDNTITLRFAQAPAANALRVTVIG